MYFNSILRIKSISLAIAILLIGTTCYSQKDTLSLDDMPAERLLVKEAFNGPQIIFSQSTNMVQAKRLDLVFGHRFGKINEGAFNAFGLDQAFIRIGLEYGITDWLTAGIGRSSLGKNYDLYFKHRPLTQTKGGDKNIPVSVAVFLSSAFSATDLRMQNEIHKSDQFVNQLAYTFQTSISRQFSPFLSVQIMGSLIHKNSVASSEYSNDVYGVGAGARLKLSNRLHLLVEYNSMCNNPSYVKNPFGVGLDVVAGGHVFTLYFANGAGIIEKATLTEIKDNGLRFGFTIRRSFMLKSKVDGGKVKY